jgi:hypothetical protein
MRYSYRIALDPIAVPYDRDALSVDGRVRRERVSQGIDIVRPELLQTDAGESGSGSLQINPIRRKSPMKGSCGDCKDTHSE